MKSKPKIDQLIEEALDSVATIEAVQVPPFFKEKVLNKMRQEQVAKEHGLVPVAWLTPKFQAAALICFVVINTVALFSYTTDDYSDDVDKFAEIYGLSETDTDSYFYQN